MDKKVLLMILDGWGIGDHTKSDVIYTMHPKYITALTEKYPHAQLRTDGENVGLPNGQMGNSEVGHMNIGAGRVVYQDLVKINRACADNSILQNPEIVKAEGEQTGLEGCLSLPGRWGIVTRPYTVRVRAQDRDGATFEVEDEDITARCFCHEIEHLDGHLFSEHCDRLLTDEELEQYLKEHEDEYEREDDE